MWIDLIWKIGIVAIILIYVLYKYPFTNNLIKRIFDYLEETLRKDYRKQMLKKKSINHLLLKLELTKTLKLGFRTIFYSILIFTPILLEKLSNLKETTNNLKFFLAVAILVIMELVVYEQLDKNMEFKIKRFENKIKSVYGEDFSKKFKRR